jgi:hypothetical protein
VHHERIELVACELLTERGQVLVKQDVAMLQEDGR